jgi:putative transposase
MPRPTRLDVPGVPQHVSQRGNDRQPCLFADADYLRYRSDLREVAMREGCAVHAYVLMTNHVHLLVTPMTEGAIGRVMQSKDRDTRYFIGQWNRAGPTHPLSNAAIARNHSGDTCLTCR